MAKTLVALAALGAAATGWVFIGGAAAGGSMSLVRTIVPGVGIGGVTLGTPLPAVHRRLGTPIFTGDGDTYGEYWQWTKTPANLIGPVEAITVDYPYVDGKPGGVTFVSTPGAWMIAGTGIRSYEHGDLAALRRFYGSRLLGPFTDGPPTGKDGSQGLYYELPGRFMGRPVHTVFRTATYPPVADEIQEVTVSFCGTGMLGSMSSEDVPCHQG